MEIFMLNVCSSNKKPIDIDLLFNFESKDECSICLELLNKRAEGDTRNYRELAKTQCKHFFHHFCLEQYLNNKNISEQPCPVCRKATLEEYYIINLDPQMKQEVNLNPVRQNNLDPQIRQRELQIPHPAETRIVAGFITSLSMAVIGVGSYLYGFQNGQTSYEMSEKYANLIQRQSQLESQLQSHDYNLANELLFPTAIVGGVGLASRLTAGSLGMAAKGASRLAAFVSDNELSQNLNYAGDCLNIFATRSLMSELQMAAGLTSLSVGIFALPAMFNGS
jgi:Ring finger domain